MITRGVTLCNTLFEVLLYYRNKKIKYLIIYKRYLYNNSVSGQNLALANTVVPMV